MEAQAARVLITTQTATIVDAGGALRPVLDEGGRHCARSLDLGVQAAARVGEGADVRRLPASWSPRKRR